MSLRKKLYRSPDSVLFGVCAGMAEYVDLNPWGVRLIWVLLTFFGGPLTVLAYVIFAVVLEKRAGLPSNPGIGRLAGLPPIPGSGRRPSYGAPDFPSRTETLIRLKQRFEHLEKRLQRMESEVTRPSFGYEKDYRDL